MTSGSVSLLPHFALISVLAVGAASPTPTRASQDTAVTGASEPDRTSDPAATARSFAGILMTAETPDLAPLCGPQLAALLSAEQAVALRTQLVSAQGAYRSLGEPWVEAERDGITRYRLPVEFERGTLDLLIPIDGSGKVVGAFVRPHVVREDQRPADPPPGGRSIPLRVGAEPALPGVLDLPDGDGPFPAVVLVHGSGPNDRDGTVGPNRPLRELSHGLVAHGVAVLRYDKRSLVDPDGLTARGAAFTLQHEVVDDAWAALDLLRERKDIDAARLYVVGHSLGGMLAPRIARREPRPAGAVSLAGLTIPIPETVLRQSRFMANLDGSIDEEEQQQLDAMERDVTTVRQMLGDEITWDPDFNFFGAPIGYYRDAEAHDPVEVAQRNADPILVVHGDRDFQVDASSLARWREGLAGRPFACIRVHPQMDHLLRFGEGPSRPADYQEPGEVAAALIDELAGWILEGRCPGAAPAKRD